MTARRIAVACLLLAAAGIALYAGRSYLRRQAAASAEAESGEAEARPVAHVEVVPLKEGTVDVMAVAFGTVEAARGETQTFSIPFESRVTRVFAVRGQQVQADDLLVEVEPSPDTLLQLEQARQQRDTAKNQLDLAKQRFEMKLTTRQDMLQAEQALSAAELSVRSMERRGIDGRKSIRAPAPGVVSQVDVQEGQIMPAGAALVDTIGKNQIVVRLGVESEDAARLHAGQAVRIEPVNGVAEAFEGKVQTVTREVDPQTRLVSVYIAPPADARLLLNEYVLGRIVIESRSGLIVPSQAIVPEESAHVLYTVSDSHAVRHKVELGPENNGEVLVAGKGLQADQKVVTVGNSQLEEGMAVEVKSAQ